jgi:hypothetical protein
MKELWAYLIQSFDAGDKHVKKIRKAQNLFDYLSAVDVLFRDFNLKWNIL